ncbi:MAG: thioredoxin domain-containing protein [Candidatus Methanoperedens sp.]|nr:thioredoxin domain-containing protein [Candidatus Methanoperedens sp.]
MADEGQTGRKPNRLISEKSPYLLQHAYNPVDWYPWGIEAFEKAKKEDKPIFLSIGYSTCHLCHVMRLESFDDHEVAKLMNKTFVAVKVDMRERPDIESVYMKICRAMTGGEELPLNIIMTPDKKPFLAITYVPKESRSGSVGVLEMISRTADAWKNNRSGTESLAAQVISSLNKERRESGKELGRDVLGTAYEQLLNGFDEHYGGFGEAPKYPAPHNLMFLLRYWKRTGDIIALRMVERTLTGMRMGGIYDHVGFGFHHYSIDNRWHLPRFEKALQDQAMLAMAYIEAFQATGSEEYGRTAREIFTFVLRDMTSPEGGFYSGVDGDSEGVEGKFYVWTMDEIRSLFGEESEEIKKIFNIKTTGESVLYLTKTIPELASSLKLPEGEIQKRLEDVRVKLLAAREKRAHPGKDDMILTDLNGLMIAALAKGASVFNEPAYAEAAQRAAGFIQGHMRAPAGRLYHRYREGEAAVHAFLNDYAFLTWGLIELYETTFEVPYLQTALDLAGTQVERFWDGENLGFYSTADDAEEILLRIKEINDGEVPSGNSVSMLNLLRLGRMTANPELENRALQTGQAFSQEISKVPASYTMLMAALDFALGPSNEVVIAGDLQADDTKAMLAALRKELLPDTVVLFRTAGGEEQPEVARLAEYAGHLSGTGGGATAYVCRDYSCGPPVTDIGKMLELLRAH